MIQPTAFMLDTGSNKRMVWQSRFTTSDCDHTEIHC